MGSRLRILAACTSVALLACGSGLDEVEFGTSTGADGPGAVGGGAAGRQPSDIPCAAVAPTVQKVSQVSGALVSSPGGQTVSTDLRKELSSYESTELEATTQGRPPAWLVTFISLTTDLRLEHQAEAESGVAVESALTEITIARVVDHCVVLRVGLTVEVL